MLLLLIHIYWSNIKVDSIGIYWVFFFIVQGKLDNPLSYPSIKKGLDLLSCIRYLTHSIFLFFNKKK